MTSSESDESSPRVLLELMLALTRRKLGFPIGVDFACFGGCLRIFIVTAFTLNLWSVAQARFQVIYAAVAATICSAARAEHKWERMQGNKQQYGEMLVYIPSRAQQMIEPSLSLIATSN